MIDAESLAAAPSAPGVAQSSSPEIRCLWIARELPFPANTGDRIYTGNLARALSEALGGLSFIGLEPNSPDDIPTAWPIRWNPVKGQKKPNWKSLLSLQPLVSAAYATQEYRRDLRAILREPWDVIVIDHYGCAWTLEAVLNAVSGRKGAPLLVYLSHNHEEALARSLFRSYEGPWYNGLVLRQNYLKIRYWERRLAGAADLIATITAEDRDQLRRHAPKAACVVLTPGFGGPIVRERTISQSCPRRVVIVGSYRWLIKQENLRNLLNAADGAFFDRGIELDVIGDVPEELQKEFAPRLRATHFHGYVDDVVPYFASARIALVPEVIGGGFKLKFLDYIFGRVPVATIDSAAAGLPENVRRYLIGANDLSALVSRVVREIDDPERLDGLQRGAFAQALPLFDWHERGSALQAAVLDVLGRHKTRFVSATEPGA
ncbi:MAG: glycosyltransferase [Burkholderiaceae bacterium]